MKKILLFLLLLFIVFGEKANAQSCAFDSQITTLDSVLCIGDTTDLSFTATAPQSDTVLPTPILNNNGQDGNMFDITATKTIRIRYFEGNIANTPSAITQYFVYYKTGTHVGFENNSAAWTLIAGPTSVAPNAPNTLTIIPVDINIEIPAGSTYAFYLTNTSAATNNNRYHNGTATGAVAATNADLTVYEGTGGAYPFGTFFNARPWEGIVHYEYLDPTYLWSTGETSTSIEVHPGTTTDYFCTATFPSQDCSVMDTITVQVADPIVIALGNDTGFCEGSDITLDAGNPGFTHSWCNGQLTQTVTLNTVGTQCVTVTDLLGCTAADTIAITEYSLPAVNAGSDQEVCAWNMITLSGAGAVSYVWDNGVNDGIAFMPATGSYILAGTDANSCTNWDTVTVVVNPLPAVSAGADQEVCAGVNITLSGSGASSYTWDNGVTNGVAFLPAMTNYIVAGTDANSCTNWDTVTVVVNSLPTVSAGADQEVCAGVNITLSGSGAASYTWDNGVTNGVAFLPAMGSYIVAGTDANSCTNWDTVAIVVNSLPAVSAGADQEVCAGVNITLSGSGAASYTWDNGVTNGVAFLPATTNYIVAGTDANTCTNWDTVAVVVNPLPAVSGGADQAACAGDMITLSGSGAASYTWDNGVTDGAAFLPAADDYIVTGTDANNCTDTDTVTVTINTLPTVTLGADIIQPSPPATLDAGAGFVTYLWSTTESTQSISVNVDGAYSVTVTDGNGCMDSDTIIVGFVTGISNAGTMAAIKLYPNPAEERIYISIENAELNTLNFRLVDLEGSTVQIWENSAVSGAFNQSYPIDHLRAGVYILHVEADGSSTPLRFIKK